MKVFLNDKIIDEKNATISIKDHGFLYGDALFESLRYKDKQLIHLELHIKRLKNSAALLGIKVPSISFKKILLQLLEENNLKSARIRITLSRGINNYNFESCDSPTLLITTEALPTINKLFYQGTKTCTLPIERLLPQIKSTQILPSILAQQKMKKENCQECFFINNKQEITEGSYSNIFFISQGILYTPPRNVCLPGTMRSQIIKTCRKNNIKVNEKNILYSEIHKFQEAFWTNDIYGMVPIKNINNYLFKTSPHASPTYQLLANILK
jgi:branched-subunit amino acid aminotransferase/4-amino-4-deoxychorismate lyase